MRSIRATATRAVLAAFLLVMAGAFVAPASAAPSKVDSSPQDGDQLHKAPEQVSISFDQPLDPESYIHVENHCDDRVDEQPTEVNGTEMSVTVTGNWAGMYHVTYFAKGIGGVTGQQTGTFTFSVHAGEGCDGATSGHAHGGGNGHEGGGHEGEHNSGTGNHGEQGHSSGSHEGAAHRSTTHASSHGMQSSSGMDHGAHASSSGDMHGDHAEMDHSQHPAGDQNDATDHISSAPTNASGSRPGTETVVLSLSLCALLGVLGGAVLRFSAPN